MTTLRKSVVLTGVAGLSLSLGQLASAAVDTYGLELYLGNGTTLALNDPARRWDFRFTPNQTLTVDSLTTRTYSGSGTLRVAVQADDGSGNASGVDLAYASWSPSTGVVSSALNTAVTLNSGTTYHVVHSVPSGSFSMLDRSPSRYGSHINDGTPDTSYSARYSGDGGASWGDNFADTDFFGLYNSSTGAAVGQPYLQTNFRTIGQDIWQGQSFTFTGWGGNTGVDQIAMKVWKGAASLPDDLRLHLYDVSTQSDLWSGVMLDKNAPVSASGAGDVVSVSLGSPVALVPGNQYILAVESLGTTADGTYQLNVNYAYDSPVMIGANFQEAYGSSYVFGFSYSLPTAFYSGDNATLRQDAFFTLHTVAVPEPASLSLLALGGLAILRRRRA